MWHGRHTLNDLPKPGNEYQLLQLGVGYPSGSCRRSKPLKAPLFARRFAGSPLNSPWENGR
jgi:hypothetical protein